MTGKNNKSGHTGVVFVQQAAKWRASIKYNGKLMNLGLHTNKEEAIKARDAAWQLLTGLTVHPALDKTVLFAS